MPLLDIAISQPCFCFRNNILAFRSENQFHNKLVVGNGRGLGLASAFSWKNLCIPGRKMGKNFNLEGVEVWRGRLMIKAVATLEIASITHKNEGLKRYEDMSRVDIDVARLNSPSFELQSSSEDSTEVEEREKLRRMRISKANKGNTPWKGRRHSPETLLRIKERTRLAMEDPKVKMKLVNLGHAQSKETRMKIGEAVRLGWERRREKLMLQEKCYHEWRDLIAEAAQKGLFGEEELQLDSYKTLNRQLEQEWLQSVEDRKNMPMPKGSKRAPKSAEQKRKISETISAKWSDPEYRDRVFSGLAKFQGILERVERKPRKKPSGDGQTRKGSSAKKHETDNLVKTETKSHVQRVGLKRSKAALFKDPFASSKLKMLKNIRAQRAAVTKKKSEAIFRAKLLIAEAEKAAQALEIAVQNSPHIQTSLIESRMLIAEAIRFIEATEDKDSVSFENDNDLPEDSTELLPQVEEEVAINTETRDDVNLREVNENHSLSAIKAEDSSFNKFILPDPVNGNASNSCHKYTQNGAKTPDELK